MKTVDSNSEYYSRLLKKLDEQETTIETLQKELAQLQQDAEARRTELEAQIRALSVE
jgi:peptidoglycan hydrolase CwlO-like protein